MKKPSSVVLHIVLFFFFFVAATPPSWGSATNPEDEKENGDDTTTSLSSYLDECTLWLAPSTLPGNTGYGIFTGVDMDAGQDIADDIIIPLPDMDIYNAHRRVKADQLWFLIFLYWWDSDSANTGNEGLIDTGAFHSGVGAAPNCLFDLLNAYYGNARFQNGAGLHRAKDPGAGAITEYGGRMLTAHRALPAGTELFVDYGEHYFLSKPQYGPVPLRGYVRAASQLFRKFIQIQRTLKFVSENDDDKNNNQQERAHTVMREFWDLFIRHQPEYPMSRILGAFYHDDPDELDALEGRDVAGDLIKLRQQQTRRSVAWLRQHGTCGDLIYMKHASTTLPQAGRGAFATRALPTGAVVAAVPLIHVANRDIMDTFPVELMPYHRRPAGQESNDEDEDAFYWANRTRVHCCSNPMVRTTIMCRSVGRSVGTVIDCLWVPSWASLGNVIVGITKSSCTYACGHTTKLIYLPRTTTGFNVDYINHNQTLANVKLQWGDPSRTIHHPEFLNKSVDEFADLHATRLAFELVATRPIQKDEEIFLDYGDAWEEAWQEHVKQWKPVPGAESYVPGWKLDEQEDVLRTMLEQETNPYPDNVEIRCWGQFLNDDWEDDWDWDKQIIQYPQNHHPVAIIHREEDPEVGYVYTIWEPQEGVQYEGLPRKALMIADKPHRSDMFLENAFRHEIRIPDELFPEAWKNKKVFAATTTTTSSTWSQLSHDEL
eukprot:scaffold4060_cov190-Amphora_coffeaeformis.AAC.8